MTPPLVVDIDGTITGPDRAVDPRTVPLLRDWGAPVVIATGKALPYPVALCTFAGLPPIVVAENGGIAFVGPQDDMLVLGDREAAQAVAEDYLDEGYDLGWGEHDLVNRWRETEIAVSRESPLGPLERLAENRGLEVVDSGFAYHVKSAELSKGRALTAVADGLGLDPADFAAIGDSENDVSTFRVAGRSFAVANADAAAREAADVVVDREYADGFLDAIERIEADVPTDDVG